MPDDRMVGFTLCGRIMRSHVLNTTLQTSRLVPAVDCKTCLTVLGKLARAEG